MIMSFVERKPCLRQGFHSCVPRCNRRTVATYFRNESPVLDRAFTAALLVVSAAVGYPAVTLCYTELQDLLLIGSSARERRR